MNWDACGDGFVLGFYEGLSFLGILIGELKCRSLDSVLVLQCYYDELMIIAESCCDLDGILHSCLI
jgi:hypothetical protein